MEFEMKTHGPSEAPQETELGTYGVEYAVAVPSGEAVNWMKLMILKLIRMILMSQTM